MKFICLLTFLSINISAMQQPLSENMDKSNLYICSLQARMSQLFIYPLQALMSKYSGKPIIIELFDKDEHYVLKYIGAYEGYPVRFALKNCKVNLYNLNIVISMKNCEVIGDGYMYQYVRLNNDMKHMKKYVDLDKNSLESLMKLNNDHIEYINNKIKTKTIVLYPDLFQRNMIYGTVIEKVSRRCKGIYKEINKEINKLEKVYISFHKSVGEGTRLNDEDYENNTIKHILDIVSEDILLLGDKDVFISFLNSKVIQSELEEMLIKNFLAPYVLLSTSLLPKDLFQVVWQFL